jgi:hypothetical protein
MSGVRAPSPGSASVGGLFQDGPKHRHAGAEPMCSTPTVQRCLLDDFRLAFNTSACLRYALARLERLCAASTSDIARAMRSAFLACLRKNLVSFTIAAPSARRYCYHERPCVSRRRLGSHAHWLSGGKAVCSETAQLCLRNEFTGQGLTRRCDIGRKPMIMRDVKPECPDCHLSFWFCQRAYVLHRHRVVAISEHHRSSKLVRAMLPAFAENN